MVTGMNRVTLLLTLAGMLTMLAPPANAQIDEDLAVGQVEYQFSCASCHGLDGKGEGPVSLFLTAKPSDLTQMSAGNNGQFPSQVIFETIDGRVDGGVHGSRTMPVWGARYLKEFQNFGGEQNNAALVEARITRLVNFLETIQE